MTKNKILTIAIFLCKFLKVIYILLFIGLTAIFIHVQVVPENYSDVYFKLNDEKQADDSHFIISGVSNAIFTTTSKFSKYKGEMPKDRDVFKLDKLTKGSLYFLYLRYVILLFLIFLCFSEFIKILESVKTIEVFQKNNEASFKKIGKYLFLVSLFQFYMFFNFEEGFMQGFYISFLPLVLMLLSFVLAEVFKEGNRLMEENELTV